MGEMFCFFLRTNVRATPTIAGTKRLLTRLLLTQARGDTGGRGIDSCTAPCAPHTNFNEKAVDPGRCRTERVISRYAQQDEH